MSIVALMRSLLDLEVLAEPDVDLREAIAVERARRDRPVPWLTRVEVAPEVLHQRAGDGVVGENLRPGPVLERRAGGEPPPGSG